MHAIDPDGDKVVCIYTPLPALKTIYALKRDTIITPIVFPNGVPFVLLCIKNPCKELDPIPFAKQLDLGAGCYASEVLPTDPLWWKRPKDDKPKPGRIVMG